MLISAREWMEKPIKASNKDYWKFLGVDLKDVLWLGVGVKYFNIFNPPWGRVHFFYYRYIFHMGWNHHQDYVEMTGMTRNTWKIWKVLCCCFYFWGMNELLMKHPCEPTCRVLDSTVLCWKELQGPTVELLWSLEDGAWTNDPLVLLRLVSVTHSWTTTQTL